MTEIIEYTGSEVPPNELKDNNRKIEKCVEGEKSMSQIDTVNNKYNVLRIIKKLRTPFKLFKKKHPQP